MNIRLLDLARLNASIRADLDAAYARVVESSSFVGASASAAFENALARAHGRRGGVGCGSGTDALALALRALGVGGGDEVIVPAMTFVATAEAVVLAGAVPVVADVDTASLLLTEHAVARVRTPSTRAVIPVHLYGHVVPFESLEAWRAAGLLVVEDGAQAHLATWRGRPLGSASDATCLSFYPGKNLGALGDGGMVMSDNQDVLNRARMLRDHGRTEKYRHETLGVCSRLDGLQAAFLEAKLDHLPAWTEGRCRLAARYAKCLEASGVPVHLVPWESGAVHHLLVVRVPAASRDPLRQALRLAGIETGLHYPVALSEQPSLHQWAGPCPVAEEAAREVLSLPMDPLMREAEVEAVCETLMSFFS